MKKTISLFIAYCSLFIFLGSSVFISQGNALSPTPEENASPSAKPTNMLDNQINTLKDRIASRVAQLKLVERRGIVGTVTNVSNTQITLSDAEDNTRFIDVDELTKFASPSAKDSFGISDIAKGSKIGTLGLYNKQSRRLLARFVNVSVFPTRIIGTVSKIDAENYSIEVLSDGKTYSADIENTTKTYSFTKDSGLTRSGFSKIKEQQHILVVGFVENKNGLHMIASRVTILPQITSVSQAIPSSEASSPSATGANPTIPQ